MCEVEEVLVILLVHLLEFIFKELDVIKILLIEVLRVPDLP